MQIFPILVKVDKDGQEGKKQTYSNFLQGTNPRPRVGQGLAGGHTAAGAEIKVEPRSPDCAESSFESDSWQLIMKI